MSKFEQAIEETMTASGASSPLTSGDVVNGANGAEVANTNSDFYATGDARVPKLIGKTKKEESKSKKGKRKKLTRKLKSLLS